MNGSFLATVLRLERMGAQAAAGDYHSFRSYLGSSESRPMEDSQARQIWRKGVTQLSKLLQL